MKESGRWWKCCTGRIVEWTFEGGLKTGNGEYGLSGTEPVINQECMLVHEKSGRFVNLSGTAIIKFITASNLWFGAVFYLTGNLVPHEIKRLAGCAFARRRSSFHDFLS